MKKDILIAVSKNYPEHKEFYVTTDGNVFINKINAENQAKALGTEFKIVTKKEIETKKVKK